MWVIPGWLQEGKKPWHEAEDLPCHNDQVAEVMEGSIYVHTIRMVDDVDKINFNGLVSGGELLLLRLIYPHVEIHTEKMYLRMWKYTRNCLIPFEVIHQLMLILIPETQGNSKVNILPNVCSCYQDHNKTGTLL